jgi:hypothetical protein
MPASLVSVRPRFSIIARVSAAHCGRLRVALKFRDTSTSAGQFQFPLGLKNNSSHENWPTNSLVEPVFSKLACRETAPCTCIVHINKIILILFQ